jgi:signal transduction histidine kinase/ActR/RegA family two-component response regulator
MSGMPGSTDHERASGVTLPFQFQGWDDPDLLDREVARRTVRFGSLLVSVCSAVFGLTYWFGGSPALAISCFIASVALAVVALVPFHDVRAQLGLALASGFTLLAFQEFLLGDVNTAITVWFLVPNLAAMLLGARLLATLGAIFTVLVVAIVAMAGALGLPIVGNEPLPAPDLVMALTMVGALLTIGAIAWISLGARRQLMAEVGARNHQLAVALEEAEAARSGATEAAAAKDRFFANLTHEIRTPLNGIAGTAELLRSTRLDDEQRGLADGLAASTENLVALVNNMLDHARLRAGHVGVEPVPVDPRRAAGNMVALFTAQAHDKGLSLTATVADDVPAWLEVDGIRMRQVIGNLVANAIKFTASGSVSIEVRFVPAPAPEVMPHLVVAVSDTGPGIAPDRLNEIFEPFVQGDASISRTHGGTGLGLAIARQVAEVLGGSLSVESTIGVGSTFRVDVPVRVLDGPPPEPDAGIAAPSPLPSPEGGPLVLLAEDNAVNRAVGVRMLERLQARVLAASDGREAVHLAADHEVDIILMDLQMPGMDGIEAARQIRAAEVVAGRRRVPIVAMTGNDPADYGDACSAAGMDRFLMKPVSLASLSDLLEHTDSGGRRDDWGDGRA